MVGDSEEPTRNCADDVALVSAARCAVVGSGKWFSIPGTTAFGDKCTIADADADAEAADADAVTVEWCWLFPFFVSKTFHCEETCRNNTEWRP